MGHSTSSEGSGEPTELKTIGISIYMILYILGFIYILGFPQQCPDLRASLVAQW